MEFILAYLSSLLQLMLFLIMFGMGMTLTLGDFKRVGQYPKAVVVGLGNQIILLPLIGLFLISILPMPPVAAIGLMILCACPGGSTSNLLSYLSKGDTALSITMTALSSILTVFTIPFIINYSLVAIMGEGGKALQLPIVTTVLNIIKLTALPVALGMFINYRFPVFSKKSQNALAIASGIFLLIALGLIVIKLSELGNVWDFIKSTGPGVICLNLLSLSVGFLSAKLLKLSPPQATTISIETGMQNSVLGITIATAPSMLNNPQMATAAGVYGIVMCITGLLLIYFFRRISQQPKTFN